MGCCASSPHARRHHRLAHRRSARFRDPADLDECYVPEDELPLYRGSQPRNDYDDDGNQKEPCSECSARYRRGAGATSNNDSSNTEPCSKCGNNNTNAMRMRPLRTFGRYRPNSVWVPDDIDGLPSTHLDDGQYLPTDPDQLLYSAEIDNGRAFRCFRPEHVLWLCPPLWPIILAGGINVMCQSCSTCDEMCCYVRKEYFKRTFYRVYPNRIEINEPHARCFGMCGCGSWNADVILTHPFDRGAFGFRAVRCGTIELMTCCWPLYGGVVARQRCQCNGSLWDGGCDWWWCDEWLCDTLCCSYKYQNIADPEETAMASSLALHAYFEGRVMTRQDMEKCLEYWRDHISECDDPVGRKRDVCCEPFCVPFPSGVHCYRNICQLRRTPPYATESNQTEELEKVHNDYELARRRQIKRYETFVGPVQKSTYCRAMGCRRVFGRRGALFCTEGCCNCCQPGAVRRQGPHEPFPPYQHRDLDDNFCASTILATCLGDPPSNVVYKRWELTKGAEMKLYEVVENQNKPNTVISSGPNGEMRNGKAILRKQTTRFESARDFDTGNSSVGAESVISIATGTFGSS